MLLLNRLSTMASECILTLSRPVYHYVLVNHPLFSIKDIIFHLAPTRNLIKKSIARLGLGAGGTRRVNKSRCTWRDKREFRRWTQFELHWAVVFSDCVTASTSLLVFRQTFAVVSNILLWTNTLRIQTQRRQRITKQMLHCTKKSNCNDLGPALL